jgi:hypothetical protein
MNENTTESGGGKPPLDPRPPVEQFERVRYQENIRHVEKLLAEVDPGDITANSRLYFDGPQRTSDYYFTAIAAKPADRIQAVVNTWEEGYEGGHPITEEDVQELRWPSKIGVHFSPVTEEDIQLVK